MGRAKNWLVDLERQAREAGHLLRVRDVTVTFSKRYKVLPASHPMKQAVCSCGWEARPAPGLKSAASSMGLHLGELQAEGFPAAATWEQRHAVPARVPPEAIVGL